MKRKLSLIAVTAILAGLLSGAPAALAARDEAVVGLSSLHTSIDPVLANYNTVSSIGRHIYNTLVDNDIDNNIIPEIATEWTRPDNMTWVFKLDLDSYTFHNGEPLTMEDVLFSFNRCYDIPQGMSYVQYIESVEGVGDTLTIHMNRAYNGLIYDLTGLVIVNEKAVKEAGDNWSQTAVGTGPYKLASFIPSNEVTLERWDGHPSIQPRLRKITFRAVSDPTSRYIGVENGEFSFVDQISGAGDIQRALSNTEIDAKVAQTLGIRFMAVNASKPPFDNPKVREALQYVIDRQSIITLGNGVDVPANTMVSGPLPQHSDVEIGGLDIEACKALLAEAGYADGFDTTLWIYSDSMKSLAEMTQAVMSMAGIRVTIEQYEVGAFFDLLDKGEHMMLLGSMTLGAYAAGTLNTYYNSEYFGSSGNFGFYANEEVMALINKALETMDIDEEIALSRQVQELVARDNPYYPLTYTSTCYATAKNLKGLWFNASGYWDLTYAYIE
ncbi:MAG: ABC transporter substrate-binding protein [Oscillospiraceae bacterium]|jgi:peptide/nickel transport system substrate-binding protein|nr:ABC transporter substrate-binding protein [Oscillospiraceae bacterium]